jgi:hypothetical protein
LAVSTLKKIYILGGSYKYLGDNKHSRKYVSFGAIYVSLGSFALKKMHILDRSYKIFFAVISTKGNIYPWVLYISSTMLKT